MPEQPTTQQPATEQPTTEQPAAPQRNSRALKGMATTLRNMAVKEADERTREGQFLHYAALGCEALAEGQPVPFALSALILSDAPKETEADA